MNNASLQDLKLLLIAGTLTLSAGLSGAQTAQGQISAPPPGADNSAPAPGVQANVAPGAKSAYQELPLGPGDAEARIIELRRALATSADKGLGDNIAQLGEWLSDMVEAHARLWQSFAKNGTTRREAEQEKSSTQTFKQLKNQAELLKAEFLIKMHRYPEALAPLVDVASSEPQSSTGQAAYQHLKDIGFSQEVQQSQSTSQPEPQPAETASKIPALQAPLAKPNFGAKPKAKPAGLTGTLQKLPTSAFTVRPNLNLKPKVKMIQAQN